MTQSLRRSVGKAWTSPAGPWPNTAKRWGSPVPFSASGKRPCRPDPRRERRMQITVAGKQVDLSDALRTRVAEHLDGIASKYFDHALEAQVTFSRARSFF